MRITRTLRRRGGGPDRRRGVAAVEFAVVLPLLTIFIFGIWDMGRLIEVQNVLEQAAREGGRTAAAGRINDNDVLLSTTNDALRHFTVEDSVKRYVELNLPGRPGVGDAVTVTLTPLDGASFVHPGDAEQLDRFAVEVSLPRDQVRWIWFNNIAPGQTELTARSVWRSMKDEPLAVDTTIPQDAAP